MELKGYSRLISEFTGRTDKAEIDEIEDMMRIHLRTLDHLCREEFSREAKIAEQVCIAMRKFN